MLNLYTKTLKLKICRRWYRLMIQHLSALFWKEKKKLKIIFSDWIKMCLIRLYECARCQNNVWNFDAFTIHEQSYWILGNSIWKSSWKIVVNILPTRGIRLSLNNSFSIPSITIWHRKLPYSIWDRVLVNATRKVFNFFGICTNLTQIPYDIETLNSMIDILIWQLFAELSKTISRGTQPE